MRIAPAPLAGLFTVDMEPHEDERGFFARTFCVDEFRHCGLDPTLNQCSISWNRRARTLRGLHWQAAPHGEVKLVRCTRGRLFDVVVDLREGSTTLGRWFGITLSAESRQALYIPEGFAHGFLTLEDDTEVLYQISSRYVAEAARGVRWNDPDLAIGWPAEPTVISARDAALPSWTEVRSGAQPHVDRGRS